MTDEQIVKAAKSAEKKTEFEKLVHSKVSRGVNSAYGIGFLEGAEWVREQIMKGTVEGKIIYLLNGDVAINIGDTEEYNLGDKVKLIIVKED